MATNQEVMSLISEIDEYGFKRSDQEIKFLSEQSDYFNVFTRRQIKWNNFESSFRNNFLLRNFTLKKFIRKGKNLCNDSLK